MAMQQTKKVDASELTPVLQGVELELLTQTRLREIRFPAPSSENIVFVFETLVNGKDAGLPVTKIHLKKDFQPAEPPEDELHPETEEVLVEAGEFRQAIPSVEQVRSTGLPRGPVTISNFGELFDLARSAIYQTAPGLNRDWSDATEG